MPITATRITSSATGATLSDLRATLRKALPSTSAWPNATLDAWIADAIRFYSLEFPRLWRYTLALTTGTQAYALPGEHGFLNVVSVEYPTGQSPQEFLTQVDERSAAFQSAGQHHALRGVADDTAASADTSQGSIVFAETVATGESAVITYHGAHAIPAAGDDTAQITVPVAHWEAIFAFVDFRAHWELETDEALSVTTVSIVLAQLGQEARRAWNCYKETVDRLRSLTAAPAASVTWSNIGL
jgi:hypothetical protein